MSEPAMVGFPSKYQPYASSLDRPQVVTVGAGGDVEILPSSGRRNERENMNGPAHYRKAEELLLEAEKASPERKATLAARAQAHATLAAACATLDASVFADHGEIADSEAWGEVTTTQPTLPEKKAARGVLN